MLLVLLGLCWWLRSLGVTPYNAIVFAGSTALYAVQDGNEDIAQFELYTITLTITQLVVC